MEYRPAEIAELIDVHVDTVRRKYIAAGCPHRRDTNGHIWIVGTQFRDWAEEIIAKRKRAISKPLAENQAWCFKCRDRVLMSNPETIWRNKYIELLQSGCPKCGTKINRARKRRSND